MARQQVIDWSLFGMARYLLTADPADDAWTAAWLRLVTTGWQGGQKIPGCSDPEQEGP